MTVVMLKPARRNWPLVAMFITGSILFLVGLVWGVIGLYGLPAPRATADVAIGTILNFWGGILLLLGWVVVAIRWGYVPGVPGERIGFGSRPEEKI